jgi:hypothetical protein
MSTVLSAYVVNLPTLATVVGSKKKQAMRDALKAKRHGRPLTDRWDELDEMGEDTGITARKALEDLVMGRPWKRGAGYVYKYVLEDLLRVHGRRAGEHSQARDLEVVSHSMLGDLDEVFTKAGCTNVLFDIYGDQRKLPPIPAFRSDIDGPNVAFVSAKRCAKARSELAENIGKIKQPWRSMALSIYGWLDEIAYDDALALYCY